MKPTGLALDWTATGIGSMPGDDAVETLRAVIDVVPDFPFLPELPARGLGADMIGRGAGVLVDLPVAWDSRWRFTPRAGRDARRIADWWDRDLDALAEVAGDHTGRFKVQLAGPWTLAAMLELPRGGRVLTDAGALRDLLDSYREGIPPWLARIRERIPHASLVWQLDEPSLAAVLDGTVLDGGAGLLGGFFASIPPVPDDRVRHESSSLLADLQVSTVVHCCATTPPIETIAEMGFDAIALDTTVLNLESATVVDPLAAATDSGTPLWPGVISATGATAGPDPVAEVRALWRRLGASTGCAGVVTPGCGLAGLSTAAAVATLGRCRNAASELNRRRSEEL